LLKAFGVDEEIAHFIGEYSIFKESKLYAKWLEEIKHFLE